MASTQPHDDIHAPTLSEEKATEILRKLAADIQADLRCPSCATVMGAPHILKCGHVSCAKCIKYAFELDLAAKIGAHPRRTAIPKDCLKKGVPKSKASLEALLAALFPKPKIASIPLATHQLSKCTLNQQLFLTYKCPQCQGPQDRLPELHSGLNELIAYLIEGLEKYGLTKEIDSVIPPQNYFDGLFLSLLP